MNAPHVVAQQQISAGRSKTLKMRLSPWKYKVRSLKLQSQAFIRTYPEAKTSQGTIKIHGPVLEPSALELAPTVSLTFENNDDKDITLMVERVAGNEDAATASMVIAM